MKLLDKIYHSSPSQSECEHIFNYIYNRESQFDIQRMTPPKAWESDKEFLLDSQADFEQLSQLKADLIFPEFTIGDLLKRAV